MTLLIKEKKYGYELHVYNTGYRVAMHNGARKYIKGLITKYSDWVNHENAACYGQGVVVDWS